MNHLPSFGLWYDFRNPLPWQRPFGQMYAEYLDQMVEAERLGYRSVWLSEHHFCEDGYTPSPLTIASAIGQRTKEMRIGTNIIILPLYDPVRVAADAATISLLTNGRLDLGVGIGYRQAEFDQFGRDMKHRPSLMEEGVEILRRAWAGEMIDFQGKRFTVNNHAITPHPEIAPRIFMAGIAPPAIERVARISDGFLPSGDTGYDDYLAALERLGKDPREGRIMAGCWAIISHDPEREMARLGDHLLYQMNRYIDWGFAGPPETTPRFPDVASAVEGGLYEFWTVEEAVEKLQTKIDRYPQIKDIHFWAQFPGESLESGQARIELLAREVFPRLRPSAAA